MALNETHLHLHLSSWGLNDKSFLFVKFATTRNMALNRDPSQVVEVYVQIIGGKVGVALLFASKIGLLCLTPKKVKLVFLLVAELLVKAQQNYIRKLMKMSSRF
jgi:hypothetical protein